MSLKQRARHWADELISFQQTNCGTLIQSEEEVKHLLEGESLLSSEFINIKIAENRRAATGIIKKTIKLGKQSEIKCLRLISDFAAWKGGSIANPNAPSKSLSFFFVFPLRIK